MDTLETITAPPPPPAPPQVPPLASSAEEPDHRRTGKIARLPRATRIKINLLIQDGVPYADIIQKLSLNESDITEVNLCRWRQGGYLDWLRHQQWLEQAVNHIDFAHDVNHEHQGAVVHQAGLHVAATQLIESLTTSGSQLLEDEPEIYARLINALTRLSREALTFEKYREACNQARQELQPLRDPKRELTDEERQAIVDKVDRILGLK